MQLLVSDADVESYKQIKSDLDVLRQSVEKSELWVYKSNKPATNTSQQHTGDEHLQQQQTLSSSFVQVPEMVKDDVPPVVITSSTHTTTITSEPILSETVAPSKKTTDNELSLDTSVTDGSSEEVDEDDEYKKIQKVIKQ